MASMDVDIHFDGVASSLQSTCGVIKLQILNEFGHELTRVAAYITTVDQCDEIIEAAQKIKDHLAAVERKGNRG